MMKATSVTMQILVSAGLLLSSIALDAAAKQRDEDSATAETSTTSEKQPPRGVRVRWYDVIKDSPVESDRQMIVFGATGQEIESLLGEDHYADWEGEDA